MIYPVDFETRLGFNQIREMILERCSTILAKEMVSEIAFSTSFDTINLLLEQTEQMMLCLTVEDDFPSGGYLDTMPFLRKVMIDGMFLEAQELQTLSRTLSLSEEIISFFASREQYNTLKDLSQEIGSFAQEIRAIGAIIDDSAKVKDSASRQLSEIRSRLTQKEREVGRKLVSILKSAQSEGIVSEDVSLSIRDGRAVIPIATAFKRKIKGLVYDESATGKTSYIEPIEIVEINNEIKELQSEEKREIVRILKTFTSTLRPRYQELREIALFISKIDFIRAKALVAISQGALKPKVVDSCMVDMVQGRHPFLEAHLKREHKPIVPLDLPLTAQKHILLISGPNAGGKSVCLKTAGLLQYMLQCGLLLPVKGNSTFGIFESIFIDIGDQQSLDNDLSTYSSHLQNMKTILKNGNNRSLVLIDEFGTGTEPTMGGAIAESILQRMEKVGMFGVITTHYTNLKYYADNSSGVANGAMSFDVQKILPLFKLEVGKPGSSFAFEIAHKIGLSEDIISSAKEKIGAEQINLEKQLREIARDKRYWENKRDRIRLAERKAEELAETYEKELAKLKEQRNTLIRDAKDKAASIVGGANKVIENTIREIKESQAEKERTKLARKQVEEFKEVLSDNKSDESLEIAAKMNRLREKQQRKAERRANGESGKKQGKISIEVATAVGANIAPSKDREIVVGSNVRVIGQTVIGKVSQIVGGKAIIHFGSISTTVPLKKLEHISKGEIKRELASSNSASAFKSNYDTSKKRLNFSQQIDLRGVRVEEAMLQSQAFVDEAYMLGFSEVKILHGKGTGALKQEIRRYLNTMPEVESTKDEHEQFGGAGITVVSIKQH